MLLFTAPTSSVPLIFPSMLASRLEVIVQVYIVISLCNLHSLSVWDYINIHTKKNYTPICKAPFKCILRDNAHYVYFTVTPMDYIDLSTILSFPACGTKQCVDVTIVNDEVLENVESFNVTLERTPGLDMRIILDPVDGVVEIIDDDGLFFNFLERELHARLDIL